MKINWIPTAAYYQQLIEESDPAVRHQQYLNHFVQPWQQMMSMVGRSNGSEDPLAGAKGWNWLLPDQTAEITDLLQTMQTAEAWQAGHEGLLKGAERLQPYAGRIPFDTVEGWLVLGDADKSPDYAKGYTGAMDFMSPRVIGQFWEPNESNLPRIGGLFAHEMHHLVRLKVFPWNMGSTTVADYIVLEGTAESFAGAIFGEDKIGYYVTDFDQNNFDQAKRLISEGLDKAGFDVIRSYIFGDEVALNSGLEPVGGMPNYGGYTIGYHLVQAYLKRTGKTIEEATFIPANEIVAESGFFS